MAAIQSEPSETAAAPMTPSQSQAEVIKQTSTSAALATCLSKTFGKVVESNGFRAYHDDILTASGKPSDPIEVMLIEQLLLAHHRIGDLHAHSACSESAEEAVLYNGAALRLMAEFRKTSLALREYRTPVATPNVTVVRQQNVAKGDQQIAYVDDKGQKKEQENVASNSELGSNNVKAITHEQPPNFIPQSTASGSRETQPVETRQVDHAGTPTLTSGGNGEQTLDPFNWSENARG